MPPRPVPAVAPDAGTGRVPATVATAVRRGAADLRRGLTRRGPARQGPAPRGGPAVTPRRETPARHLWADLARNCLALAHGLLPRTRPTRTVTVSVATTGTSRPEDSPS
ncbi:hypothetical protein ABZ397_07355 [Streptomyces sp. NPDC005876]|uniref:hypothetical protein n=1 Tax=Streptomyces sp. NPDC005876 TaxID=3157076 RepID=UPI003409B43E